MWLSDLDFIHKAFEIVVDRFKLVENIFCEIAVFSCVVIQVEWIKNHKVCILLLRLMQHHTVDLEK